jgi:hypothetical protein
MPGQFRCAVRLCVGLTVSACSTSPSDIGSSESTLESAWSTSSSLRSIAEGACLSALFAYEPNADVATFISQRSGLGPSDQILLPGRITTIPSTVDLTTLRTRLDPTNGVAYPAETGESFCPGP